MVFTKAILEKQSQDLRTRLENFKIKSEMKIAELMETIKQLTKSLLDKDKIVHMLQKCIEQITAENKKLHEENDEQALKIDVLEDKVNKLTGSLKKTSSNSGKPPASDGLKKPPAKTKSTRQKSEKKRGGQEGHEGRTLPLHTHPAVTVKNMPPEICECGGGIVCGDEYIAKQVIDIAVSLVVTEEQTYSGVCKNCGKRYHGAFSEKFVNPVQYGAGLKALVAMLNAYANVSMNKITEMLESITDGQICLSDGSVVNILHELSMDLEQTIEFIKQRLIESHVLCADETGCRVNGKLNWFQIFTNEEYTLFGHNAKRSSFCIQGQDLLLLFTGILMHDHLKTYYTRYADTKMDHAECNVHILRYLLAVQEIQKHAWARSMFEFLLKTNQRKQERIAAGFSAFDEQTQQNIRDEYLSILEEGQKEYETAVEGKTSITYYNEERCLLARLKEYADQHLLFVMDFQVPFGNNNAEQGARIVKGKTKSSGGFRSDKGAVDYARIASLIATLRKQKLNVAEAIEALFNGNVPSFVADG
jgi:hypothetical protein